MVVHGHGKSNISTPLDVNGQHKFSVILCFGIGFRLVLLWKRELPQDLKMTPKLQLVCDSAPTWTKCLEN